MWRPEPILGTWTPDQARVAAHFPQARRVCVCAANGVGKTFLAADLAVSFLFSYNRPLVLFTAPTQRQVEQLLWAEIVRRLKYLGLMPPAAPPGKPEWEREGRTLYGFATNQPERLQGFHAPHMLLLIDEASGMTAEMLEAIEAVAIGDTNYVFAIGNPNEPYSPFYELTQRPSWRQETLSALTHPNILHRREVIPGATNWNTLLQRAKDWCRIAPTETDDTFTLQLTPQERAYLTDRNATEPPPPEGPRTEQVFLLPNDAFRVRYLGRFPAASSDTLFSPQMIQESMQRPIAPQGRRFAALDVAREGGDRTIYALRAGDAIATLCEIPPGPFPRQAECILGLLYRDRPETLTVECAGLGIGLYDLLYQRATCPVLQFQPAGKPFAPQDRQRYLNRRAQAYGKLAEAMREGRVSLPDDPELRADLAAIRYRTTPDLQMQILDKESIKARTGRSPDRADAIAILWEHDTPAHLTMIPRRARLHDPVDW